MPSVPRRGRLLDKSKLASERGDLTQQELADEADVPLSCVLKAELYGRRTNQIVISKLVDALGCQEYQIT
jgi:hypothetical protein